MGRLFDWVRKLFARRKTITMEDEAARVEAQRALDENLTRKAVQAAEVQSRTPGSGASPF